MEPIGILIAEPDPIRREGLAACLKRETSLRLVGMGRDYIEACRSCPTGIPVNLILLNLDSPRMVNLRDWSLLRTLLPDVPIAGLTEGRDDRVLEAALAGGVVALHQLRADPDVIRRAARRAAAGRPDYDPDLAHRLKMILMHPAKDSAAGHNGFRVKSVRKRRRSTSEATEAEDGRAAVDPEKLTTREMQVLARMAQGMDNKQIASRLDVSVSTVKFHVSNIYTKLGVRSRVQAVLAGLEQGWITAA